VRELRDFSFSDLEWEEMMIPISLAFFFRESSGKIIAIYPSPAGAIESQLTLSSLTALFAQNRKLREMAPEVEALMVNRVGDEHAHFIVPIDDCFRLVGLIRIKWHGLSGGVEVWSAIAEFFTELHHKAERVDREPARYA
jgi:hypothetical protein